MKRCPTCGKKRSPDDNREWLPFCSERCSLMDLGDWLGERHRIPAYDTENYTDTTDGDYTRH